MNSLDIMLSERNSYRDHISDDYIYMKCQGQPNLEMQIKYITSCLELGGMEKL